MTIRRDASSPVCPACGRRWTKELASGHHRCRYCGMRFAPPELHAELHHSGSGVISPPTYRQMLARERLGK